MLRTNIINALVDKYGYNSYLEIGISSGNNFNAINCEYKVGVDPKVPCTFQVPSDIFFEMNNDKFDIIFIDGLHESEQVARDIVNSLDVLNEGGTIVMHDCNPPNEVCQRVPRESVEWTGDVWKAYVQARERTDLNMFVVDTDYGCAVVQRGKQKGLKVTDELTYENLDKNRSEWLNLKTVNEFKEWLITRT